MLLPIIIPNQKLNRSDLEQFKNNPFENVIKFVVDVNQQLIAIGGEMHANNFGMEVESEAIRDQIKAIVFKWIAL
jgi:hypothetical protein